VLECGRGVFAKLFLDKARKTLPDDFLLRAIRHVLGIADFVKELRWIRDTQGALQAGLIRVDHGRDFIAPCLH
jgi:hypothetical protein